MVKINDYIESGILESYVLGSASEAEAEELLYLKKKHPQIREALQELEIDLERIAQHMAITPPPGAWIKIEAGINELIRSPESEAQVVKMPPNQSGGSKGRKKGHFIEVESASSHMRIHKIWRWVLGGIFILGKIFLAFAIYFYLSSRQKDEQIKELKMELKNHAQKTP